MKKLIKRREIPAGNPVSDNALLDRLYRSRHIKNSQELDRTLQSMLNPNQLHGIQQAVSLLVDAYQQQQKIVIVGDFDADGATSTALSVLPLRLDLLNTPHPHKTIPRYPPSSITARLFPLPSQQQVHSNHSLAQNDLALGIPHQ